MREEGKIIWGYIIITIFLIALLVILCISDAKSAEVAKNAEIAELDSVVKNILKKYKENNKYEYYSWVEELNKETNVRTFCNELQNGGFGCEIMIIIGGKTNYGLEKSELISYKTRLFAMFLVEFKDNKKFKFFGCKINPIKYENTFFCNFGKKTEQEQ